METYFEDWINNHMDAYTARLREILTKEELMAIKEYIEFRVQNPKFKPSSSVMSALNKVEKDQMLEKFFPDLHSWLINPGM